jgi:hypothetical protein
MRLSRLSRRARATNADRSRETLEVAQARLVNALVTGGPVVEGFDPRRFVVESEVLARKRARPKAPEVSRIGDAASLHQAAFELLDGEVREAAGGGLADLLESRLPGTSSAAAEIVDTWRRCVYVFRQEVVGVTSSPDGPLATLPSTFSFSEARERGLSERRLYALRDAGVLEMLGRGLYRRTDAPIEADTDLLEIAHRAAESTLCLTTALARHGLSDAIPGSIDVALPRGHRHPRTQAPVTWHAFAADTFGIGRDELLLADGVSIGLYSVERCIVDAFRLRHLEGPEVAHEALRRWLRRRGTQPATLLAMARSFPKAGPALRTALEIML